MELGTTASYRPFAVFSGDFALAARGGGRRAICKVDSDAGHSAVASGPEVLLPAGTLEKSCQIGDECCLVR